MVAPLLRIGITGSDGLLGYHLRAFLHRRKDLEVRLANRATFADAAALRAFASECDAIAHFAGMNRGADDEIESVNAGLAQALVDACDAVGRTPHIVFSSSTHIDRDTAYGCSKRRCGEIFNRWAERRGGLFTNLILPHVFGEFGRPFYNSVVATFCHQLARGETPTVIQDGELELLHAQQVAEEVLRAIVQRDNAERRIAGVPMRVTALLETLQRMNAEYRAQLIPDLREAIDLRLFNVLRANLFPSFYPVRLELRSDARGHLFEGVRTLNGGQAFMSTTRPGVTRGNHYHTRKFERFLVSGGEAVIRLRQLFTREVVDFRVAGADPCYIDMPTFHTHSITNTAGGELVTLFWTNELFDPADPDTFTEPVETP